MTMKTVAQITAAIVAAVVILFVGSAFMSGAMEAVDCLKRHTAKECQAQVDRERAIKGYR
jgi:hypothetical protein